MTQSRIGKLVDHGGSHPPFVSRDYLEGMLCKCSACFCNDKHGRCGQPAMAQLNAEAVCETYLSFKDNPPVLPPRRCKVCGGRVKPAGKGMVGKWEHDGEQLSHEVVI